MRKIILVAIVSVFITGVCITSCVHKPQVQLTNGYPPPIAAILVAKCATAGCHDQGSYHNAAGLLLDSWTHLFNGDDNGAQVIAYNTEFSTLLYYVNTDSSLGTIENDPGHIKNPLSHDEYMTLCNWIANGAPDVNGNIPFASNAATRQKLYLTNQGCNVVSVIDGASKLVMRVIPVGDATDQAPHSVAISSDGMYGYLPFYNGSIVQKIDNMTDTIIGSVNLGLSEPGGTGGAWSVAIMSPLDTAFMVSGWSSPGSIATVNTANMKADGNSIFFNSNIPYPHGLASNATFDTFFAALDYGNVILKFSFQHPFFLKQISVNGSAPTLTNITDTNNTTPDPHQIQMAPDYSKYFVTCQSTNVVAVMDPFATSATNAVIATIPVGGYPQEMDVSPSRNLLYVTCMQDGANPNPGCLGSVYVIDMGTLRVVNILYGNFYQPHGIAVDEQDGYLYVPSRDVSTSGPPPHHATACAGGRPAWYTVYNLNTLTPADSRQYNVPSDAYVITARFR